MITQFSKHFCNKSVTQKFEFHPASWPALRAVRDDIIAARNSIKYWLERLCSPKSKSIIFYCDPVVVNAPIALFVHTLLLSDLKCTFTMCYASNPQCTFSTTCTLKVHFDLLKYKSSLDPKCTFRVIAELSHKWTITLILYSCRKFHIFIVHTKGAELTIKRTITLI